MPLFENPPPQRGENPARRLEQQEQQDAKHDRPASRTRLGARLALILGSLAVAVTLGEVLVRLILGDRMVLFPRYHSKAVYGEYTLRRLRPNTTFWHTSTGGRWKFVINDQGFRNTRNFPHAKTSNRMRIIATGDSHTQGFEVRQEFTYSAAAERWLKSRGVDVEVLNAGVSGFSTSEVIAFLENEGIKYHPDVVLYGLYANDFLDNLRSGLFSLEGDTLVVKRKSYAPAVAILDVLNELGPVRWLSENSYLYSLAFNTAWDFMKALSSARARKEALAEEHAKPISPISDYEMSLMVGLLDRLGDFCRERGILLVLIDIPVPEGRGSGKFATSIPLPIRQAARRSSDVVLFSEDVFGPHQGKAEIHVPHGQNHLSEFAHGLLGTRAGEAIINVRRRCGSSERRLALCALDGGS